MAYLLNGTGKDPIGVEAQASSAGGGVRLVPWLEDQNPFGFNGFGGFSGGEVVGALAAAGVIAMMAMGKKKRR